MNLQEREWRLIYSCVVAGKSATFADGVMERLGPTLEVEETPLASLGRLTLSGMESLLRRVRSGNYAKLSRCFYELATARIDLFTCTPSDLERIHGIGPKTSRFFILWTRPGERYAALDVHVLRWLRERGHDAPRATPTGAKYAQLEAIFLTEADARGLTPRELDFEIWGTSSKAA